MLLDIAHLGGVGNPLVSVLIPKYKRLHI